MIRKKGKSEKVRKIRRRPWPAILLIQMLTMLPLGAVMAASLWLGSSYYKVCMYVLMPLGGLISAYRATLRGLINYAAWLLPPICMAVGHVLMWFYVPDTAPVLLCALTSLVGAAAGEVRLRDAAGAQKSEDN